MRRYPRERLVQSLMRGCNDSRPDPVFPGPHLSRGKLTAAAGEQQVLRRWCMSVAAHRQYPCLFS